MRVVIDARIATAEEGGVEQCLIGLAVGLATVAQPGDAFMFLCTTDSTWLQPYTKGRVRIINPKEPVRGVAERIKSSFGGLRPYLGRAARSLRLTKSGRMSEEVACAEEMLGDVQWDAWHTLHPYLAVRSQKPVILTLHDLQHLRFPEFFSEEHIEWRMNFYKKAVAACDHLTTGSNSARDDIMSWWPPAADKLTVIRWAPPIACYRSGNGKDKVSMVKKINLDSPYGLFPSVTYQHKNHERLLEAIALARDRFGVRLRLICSGRQKHHWPVIERRIRELNLEHQVHFAGFVSERDLKTLFDRAAWFVFPSLFEGAGLGLIEALYAKLPIACSDISVFHEYAGDSAVYFNPFDPTDIALKLVQVATGQMTITDRVWMRNWSDVAAEYVSVYGSAIKQSTSAVA